MLLNGRVIYIVTFPKFYYLLDSQEHAIIMIKIQIPILILVHVEKKNYQLLTYSYLLQYIIINPNFLLPNFKNNISQNKL